MAADVAPHVVVGAGAVGSVVAELLVDRGERVRVITRRGTAVPGAEPVAADASDAARLSELTAGAAVVYNCVSVPYRHWLRDWPPIAQALLTAAETSGAVLAVTGNLYGYGPVEGVLTEDLPLAATGRKGRLRAAMSEAAFAAHRAGRVRVVEVRGSDYLGGDSVLSAFARRALRDGGTARVPADLDAPHSWTNVRDVAMLLVTAAADPRAWGRAWHVPSAPACSIRELARLAAAATGKPARLRTMPLWALRGVAVVHPLARELLET
ncbi:NAD-dependent epimerase/dehydratase family protein, partial [Jatrophihabitans sp.]|uniref:NAD-dependent epimerase/dehydratase family protein n=1 Tax=Jatrophihabitans sp. TaxID=1932789 RepID=UPI002F1667D3